MCQDQEHSPSHLHHHHRDHRHHPRLHYLATTSVNWLHLISLRRHRHQFLARILCLMIKNKANHYSYQQNALHELFHHQRLRVCDRHRIRIPYHHPLQQHWRHHRDHAYLPIDVHRFRMVLYYKVNL